MKVPDQSSTVVRCPVTQVRGKRVDTATVKCLLDVSLAAIRDEGYFFCDDPTCSVVYFSTDGSHRFYIQDIRERVYQKEPSSEDVLVCYCFRYTQGQIVREVQSTGRSTISEDITNNIIAGKCACDWRNPQGSCCIGNVKRIVAAYRSPSSGN